MIFCREAVIELDTLANKVLIGIHSSNYFTAINIWNTFEWAAHAYLLGKLITEEQYIERRQMIIDAIVSENNTCVR